MSKKKNVDRMKMEEDLVKLMEEVKKYDFESIDELDTYIRNMMGQGVDDFPERLDNKERSQNLVFDAYELPVAKAKKLIKQALELDPNNVDAYNYMASVEEDVDKAIELYEKAIKISENILGKEFFEEEKGHFWGFVETRPYMRAKSGLADCFNAKNEVDKAIEIYEEMLELNPNDNQGIRFLLSTILLEKDDLTKFELFIKNYEEEDCTFLNFNIALYNFKKFGKKAKTDELLLNAHKSNEFVIDYLLGRRELPDEQSHYIGIGDESEAIAYVFDNWRIWNNAEGAFLWLYEFGKKKLNL